MVSFTKLAFSYCCTSASKIYKFCITCLSHKFFQFHKFKFDSLFILSCSLTQEYTGLPLTGGNCGKSPRITTVSPTNATDTVQKKSVAILTAHQLIPSLLLIICFLDLLSFYQINQAILDLALSQDLNELSSHLRLLYICLLCPTEVHGVSLDF